MDVATQALQPAFEAVVDANAIVPARYPQASQAVDGIRSQTQGLTRCGFGGYPVPFTFKLLPVVRIELDQQRVALDLPRGVGKIGLEAVTIGAFVLPEDQKALAQPLLYIRHQIPANQVELALHLELAGLHLLAKAAFP